MKTEHIEAQKKALMEKQYLERQEFLLQKEAEKTAYGDKLPDHRERHYEQGLEKLNQKHMKEFQQYSDKNIKIESPSHFDDKEEALGKESVEKTHAKEPEKNKDSVQTKSEKEQDKDMEK